MGLHRKPVIIGKKYHRLTIINEAKDRVGKSGKIYRMVNCKCECGTEKIYFLDYIKNGRSKSCGCFKKDVLKKRLIKHGLSQNRWQNIYSGMKQRCYNKNHEAYPIYGGRGITVCDKWLRGIEYFYQDMKKGYSDKLTLDRIDNNLGYSKENCRWATKKQQANNIRTNINHNIRGVQNKIKHKIFQYCLNKKIIVFNGEGKGIKEWCNYLGLNYSRVSSRISVMGWTKLEALELIPRIKTYKKRGS